MEMVQVVKAVELTVVAVLMAGMTLVATIEEVKVVMLVSSMEVVEPVELAVVAFKRETGARFLSMNFISLGPKLLKHFRQKEE